MSLRAGTHVSVPVGLGEHADFTIWSAADEGPGTYFAVPVDGSSSYKYVVIRATHREADAYPTIELLRTETR